MKAYRLLAIGVLALFLGACASQDIPDPDAQTNSSSDSSADTSGTDEGDLGGGEFFDPNEGEPDGELIMTIYFGFDQSEVRADDQATLEQHAIRLSNESRSRMRLEGHADETSVGVERTLRRLVGTGQQGTQAAGQPIQHRGLLDDDLEVALLRERGVERGTNL